MESKTRPVKAKLSKVCRFEKVLGTRKLQETEGPSPNRSVSRGRKAVAVFFRNPKSEDLARRARVQWENKDTYAPGCGLPLRGRPKLLPRPFPSAPRDLDPKAGRGGRFKHPPPPRGTPPLGPAWAQSEQTPSSKPPFSSPRPLITHSRQPRRWGRPARASAPGPPPPLPPPRR